MQQGVATFPADILRTFPMGLFVCFPVVVHPARVSRTRRIMFIVRYKYKDKYKNK